jgi:hypothetical protein
MPQSMGSPTQIPLVGVGSGPIGPPHVVPSRVNSLGGQVPGSQLLQGLDGPRSFPAATWTNSTSSALKVKNIRSSAGKCTIRV